MTAPRSKSWEFMILAPTDWINLNQQTHWAEKARRVRAWRLSGSIQAQAAQLPRGLRKVHVTAHIIKPTSRSYDAHNLIPTVKAIIDGLVDYGLVPDDANKYLTGPDMREGGKGQAGVKLTITALEDSNGINI